MVAPDALGSLADVEFAARIAIALSCDGDRVLIHLVREDGAIFAAAVVSPDGADSTASVLNRYATKARSGEFASGGLQ